MADNRRAGGPTCRTFPARSLRARMRDLTMSIDDFRDARDFLLALRTDYSTAKAKFAWPKFDCFNWALDWFDGELAAGEHGARPALTLLGEPTETYSFAELSEASSRVANCLARARRRARRPAAADARQCRAAMDRAAGGDEARPGGHPGAAAARGGRRRRTAVARPRAPRRRRGGRCGEVRGAQRRPAGARRRRRRAGGLARLGRAHAGEPAFRAGRADAAERPAAALFYFRHHGAAEAGAAHARELSGRPSDDHVRARPAARRHASQHFLARLGQARVVECLRAVERRRDRRRADGALRCARRPRSSRRPSDHFVLRPADGLAPVHSARSRPVERRRCARFALRASRSIRR